MKAIGYIRRSEEVELDDRKLPKQVSLEVQEAGIRKEAKKLNAELVSMIVHNGVSGGKRSRFTELEKAVALHGADAVIVYHFDRFGRDVVGELMALERLHQRGVKLVACNRGQIDISRSDGFLLTTVEAMVAQYHRMIASEKIKDAMVHLRRQRRITHQPEIGERIGPDGLLELDPHGQEILRLIDLYRKIPYSWRYIAKLLSTKRPTNYRKWTSQFVRKIYERWVNRGRKPSWEI